MPVGGEADDLRARCTAGFVTVPCMQVEIGALRDDIAPALMRSPLSLEETVQRYVRPHLREVAINLCQQPVAEYLNRFDFRRCVPLFQCLAWLCIWLLSRMLDWLAVTWSRQCTRSRTVSQAIDSTRP